MAKLPERLLPSRLPPRKPLKLVALRRLTDSDQAPSLSVRSAASRRAPSSSSESSPSRDSLERSLLSSRLILDSSPQLSSPFRRPPRLTSSVSSKTPTSPPSTPDVSPSCPRISSSPAESAERELDDLYNRCELWSSKGAFSNVSLDPLNYPNFNHSLSIK